MKKIEILAPAGSYEGMKAAMNAGCDAVYIGGSSFGARAYADNPDEDTLLRAIDEAHIRDKKLYMTVNTLLKEKELTGSLYSFLEKYYLQGLDAVIVQDVGVMHFIHKYFPQLQIHASTQMTLTMAQGAELLKDCGVNRLVTSRELSLDEIREIRRNTDLEIETFVHGALCYCYSGQCLMSSIIGGRSGNRGRCAQPCRMPYQFYDDNKRIQSDQGKYLLSPKDINTIGIIPELVEAGIDSFKIEGRMKRPEYAAAVASMYRKYTDLYFELGKDKYYELLNGSEYKKDMILLQDVYNRGGFSEGYGRTYHGKSMMSPYRPNHSGVYVGKVEAIKGREVSIRLKEMIHEQDILEIRHREEEGYEFTVKDSHTAGDIITTVVGKRADSAPKSDKGHNKAAYSNASGLNIHIDDAVYRTKNNELMDQLAVKYIAEDKKLGITGRLTAKFGEKLTLTAAYRDCEVTAYQETVEKAVRQPMSIEKLRAPIEKTGDTLYYFEELTVDAEEDIFVPVSWLNEIRREALNRLKEEVAEQYRRSIDSKESNKQAGCCDRLSDGQDRLTGIGDELPDGQDRLSDGGDKLMVDKVGLDEEWDALKNGSSFVPSSSFIPESETKNIGINISVQTEEQFEAALKFPEVGRIYAEYDRMKHSFFTDMAFRAHAKGKEFYLALPLICRLSVYNRLKKEIKEIIYNESVTGFLIKNYEEFALLQSLMKDSGCKKEIILNHNMYIFNKEAKEFWKDRGISHFTAPVELNYQELRNLGVEDCDLLVYGYLPLMISAQCLLENTTDCRKSGQNNTGYLTDRLGKKFLVQTNCSGCYNIIYNGQPLALHKQDAEIKVLKPDHIRLDFSFESGKQTEQIIASFMDTFRYGTKNMEVLKDYTTGHFKRGAL